MSARAFVFAVAGLLPCLASGPAIAQVNWEVGFKGGASLAELTGDTGLSESIDAGPYVFTISGDIGDIKSGFTGGGFATARFGDRWGVRFEVLYEQAGSKGTIEFGQNGVPTGSAEVTYRLDYIEVPILAVGTFAAGRAARVDVFAGPALAFVLDAKLKSAGDTFTSEEDIGNSTQDTDIGFAAGAGLSFPVSPAVHIVVDGRYTLGFSDVLNSRENVKNGGFAFMTGISLPIGAP